jgi:hypothetical protein
VSRHPNGRKPPMGRQPSSNRKPSPPVRKGPTRPTIDCFVALPLVPIFAVWLLLRAGMKYLKAQL